MDRRLDVVIAVILTVGGCSGSATPTSPTSPSSVLSPAGTWSGAITDPVSGEGTAQLSLNEGAANSLTGSWSAIFKNGDRFSGPAVAILSLSTGYGITLSVQPPPPCASGSGSGGSDLLGLTLVNVVITSSRLTAAAGRVSCSGLGFGTVNLSKQ